MVAKPQTVFWVTRKMVFAFRKIFFFEKTIVSGIENIVCVMQTVFTTTSTTVAAAQKIVSFASTIV